MARTCKQCIFKRYVNLYLFNMGLLHIKYLLWIQSGASDTSLPSSHQCLNLSSVCSAAYFFRNLLDFRDYLISFSSLLLRFIPGS